LLLLRILCRHHAAGNPKLLFAIGAPQRLVGATAVPKSSLGEEICADERAGHNAPIEQTNVVYLFSTMIVPVILG